jgi:hypothetical protein
MSGSVDKRRDELVSEKAMEIVETVHIVFIAAMICLFGVVTNVMNMVIFYKQGFHQQHQYQFPWTGYLGFV